MAVGIYWTVFGAGVVLVSHLLTVVATDEPTFGEPVQNVTVALNRRATLSCVVDNLGSYRIAWLKYDTYTILTIHTHVITHNSRVSVSRNGLRQWFLHIDSVKEIDRGFYMCQINTSPMKTQYGFLEVVIPPDISRNETSSDVSVVEGDSVSLTCKAVGYPKPVITWRREDNELIALRVPPKERVKVHSVHTDTLNISRVHRRHMGVYLCIASNGVPPSVSKRVQVQVNFQPTVNVPNQLVGAPIGTNVELECLIEMSPLGSNFWTKDNGEVVFNGTKYRVTELLTARYKLVMHLVIRDLEIGDFGIYNCVSRNYLGDAQGSIRLRVLELPSTSVKVDIQSKITENKLNRQFYTTVYPNDSYYHQKSTETSNDFILFGVGHSIQGDVNNAAREFCWCKNGLNHMLIIIMLACSLR